MEMDVGQIADYFGLVPADFPAQPSPLESQMADDQAAWSQLAAEHGLKETDISRLASPWAHRRRLWAPDRGGHGHVQEQEDGVHRLPGEPTRHFSRCSISCAKHG